MTCPEAFNYRDLEALSSDPFAFTSPTFCFNNRFLFIVSLTWLCLLFVAFVVVTGVLVRLLIKKGLKYEARKQKERDRERGDRMEQAATGDEAEDEDLATVANEEDDLGDDYDGDHSDLESGKRQRRNRRDSAAGEASRSRSRSRGRAEDGDLSGTMRPRSNTFNSVRSATTVEKASTPGGKQQKLDLKKKPSKSSSPGERHRRWSWRWNAACTMVLFGDLVLLGLLGLELGHFFAARGVLKVVTQGLPIGMLITGVTYVMMKWYEVIIGQLGRYSANTPAPTAPDAQKPLPAPKTLPAIQRALASSTDTGKNAGLAPGYVGVNPSASSLSSSGLSIFSRPSSPVPTATQVPEVLVDVPLNSKAAATPVKKKVKDQKRLKKVLLMWFLIFNAIFHLFFWPPWIASGVLEGMADANRSHPSAENGTTSAAVDDNVELRNLLVGCSLVWVGVCGLLVSFFIAALGKKLIGMLDESNQLTGSKKIQQIIKKVFRYSGVQGMIWLGAGGGLVGLGIWGVVNRADGVQYFYYLMNFWLVPSMFLGGLLLVYAGINGNEGKEKKGENHGKKHRAPTPANQTGNSNPAGVAAASIPPTTANSGTHGPSRLEEGKKWLLTRSPSLSSISSAATTATTTATNSSGSPSSSSSSSSGSPLSPMSSVSSPYPLSATASTPGGMLSPISPAVSPFSSAPLSLVMRLKMKKPTSPLPSTPGSSDAKEETDAATEEGVDPHGHMNIAMMTLNGVAKRRRQRSMSSGTPNAQGSPLARGWSGDVGPTSVIVESVHNDGDHTNDEELNETV